MLRIQVKEAEASSNNGYEAESKAFYHHILLQKQVARAENNVSCLYIQIVKKCKFTRRPQWGGLHGWVVPNQMHGWYHQIKLKSQEYEQVTLSNISSKHYLFQ